MQARFKIQQAPYEQCATRGWSPEVLGRWN